MSKVMVCVLCHTAGKPKTEVRGSTITELLLWFMFIVPGVIYSLWRAGAAYKACRACGSSNLVPLDSPAGKSIIKDLNKPR